MQIFLLHIDKYFTKEEIALWTKDWSFEQRENILSYQQQKDFNATFFGKLLLKHALHGLGIEWEWEDICHTEKGKPYIKNQDIDFNLSHSGDNVVLAINNSTVGIDIEMHRSVKLELFNRQFQAHEWQMIKNAEDSLHQFFKFWSVKEAAIKADGRGVEVISKTIIVSEREILVEDNKWFFQSFSHIKGYSVAVCTKDLFFFNPKDIQTIGIDILLEHL